MGEGVVPTSADIFDARCRYRSSRTLYVYLGTRVHVGKGHLSLQLVPRAPCLPGLGLLKLEAIKGARQGTRQLWRHHSPLGCMRRMYIVYISSIKYVHALDQCTY